MNLRRTKNIVSAEGRTRTSAVVSGVLIGYAITCIVFLGYAMLITYSNFTGQGLPLVVTVTSLAAVLIAGFDAARGAESRGWLWGLIAGFVYILILICIGAWVNNSFQADLRTITLFVLALAGGGLGGMFGINFKR
ncbi:MAG: TIGR04086 family membrane protein [Defluviitaleaceae bacterium]|nr:TIGR04086 family membrane protein [Defluviitaleaceae bacterium]